MMTPVYAFLFLLLSLISTPSQAYSFSRSSNTNLSGGIDRIASTPTESTSLLTRRDWFLSTTALAVPATLLALKGNPIDATTTSSVKPLGSLSDALDIIEQSCNRKFLHSVVASDYNFLYRGISTSEADFPTVRSEPCDLLDPQTYGKDGAEYMNQLDIRMSGEPIRPSNGHLAVTCPKVAAQWGVAASIWPLGGNDDVHFAWFEQGGLFYPRAMMEKEKIIVDGVDCGIMSLEDALKGDAWEVLFRAERFLAVPITFEEELRQKLRQSFII